jgi:hypothetical protein
VQWRAALARSLEEAQRQKGIFDRGLFYLIQPPERLQALAQRVNEAITPVP